MPLSVAVYHSGKKRSEVLAKAMARGMRASGDRFVIRHASQYEGKPDTDATAFYGFTEPLRTIFRDYRALDRPVVCIDLGYWGRRDGGKFAGFHKITVNDRHPTAYLQSRKHDKSRVKEARIKIAPWRTGGDAVLVAGMSEKAAGVYGLRAEEWERDAVAKLRKYTKRPIIYRPKPSWLGAGYIDGTAHSPAFEPIESVLARSHAVVTHHSNVAVDGLLYGVPAFTVEGAASPMALDDISKIETPLKPEGREQWIADVSWTQFSLGEMATGFAWQHLKAEGLIK